MAPSRVTPLAGWTIVAIFVLIGVALVATVWTTRSSVIDASDAVGRGQALAIEQAVRADLADLEAVPSTEDLARILEGHRDEGLRFVGMIENRGQVVASAGTSTSGTFDRDYQMPPRGERLILVDGRIRLTVRGFRRMKAGPRMPRYVVEIEPIQAMAMRDASTLTLGIGALAAASLLGVAMALIWRESRRAREDRERERERRLASLGEMSAVLAHEIKNPLASLKGNAQLLSQMIAKALPDSEKVRTKSERVVDEAIRLEKLIVDLLKFVRTGAIERSSVDPTGVVREAIAAVPSATPEAVSLQSDGAPNTWSLDAGRLREVVINLVDNAIDAGAPVIVRVKRDRRDLVLEVEDKGPGVPADEREKIFEPFFTGKTQGTGLGLAVARRVVELHGGTLVVREGPHGGALFRAQIPES